jgi:hypothetical protein
MPRGRGERDLGAEGSQLPQQFHFFFLARNAHKKALKQIFGASRFPALVHHDISGNRTEMGDQHLSRSVQQVF